MKQQTFTRKEVTALLKAQVAKSANSYGKMEVPMPLASHFQYGEELEKTHKRLKRVTLVKY
jgi:hypothetical protein